MSDTDIVVSPNLTILPRERLVPADDASLREPVPGETWEPWSDMWAADAHWPGEGADEKGEGGFRDSPGVLDVWMAEAKARMDAPMPPSHAQDCPHCPPKPAPPLGAGSLAAGFIRFGGQPHDVEPAPVAASPDASEAVAGPEAAESEPGKPVSLAASLPVPDLKAVPVPVPEPSAGPADGTGEGPDATKVIDAVSAETEIVPTVKDGGETDAS